MFVSCRQIQNIDGPTGLLGFCKQIWKISWSRKNQGFPTRLHKQGHKANTEVIMVKIGRSNQIVWIMKTNTEDHRVQQNCLERANEYVRYPRLDQNHGLSNQIVQTNTEVVLVKMERFNRIVCMNTEIFLVKIGNSNLIVWIIHTNTEDQQSNRISWVVQINMEDLPMKTEIKGLPNQTM